MRKFRYYADEILNSIELFIVR